MIEKDLNCLDFFQERFSLICINFSFDEDKIYYLNLEELALPWSVTRNSISFGVTATPGFDFFLHSLEVKDGKPYTVTIQIASNLGSVITYSGKIEEFDFQISQECVSLLFKGDINIVSKWQIEPKTFLTEGKNV